MTFAKLLPLVMTLLSVAAAGAYALDGDWRHCVYWLAAGVLTGVVTTF